MTSLVLNNDYHPAYSKKYLFVISFTCLFIVLLELMDVTIAAIVLPSIKGSLGSSLSATTWVISGFTTASALLTPLSGFLTKNFGRRKLLLSSVTLFTFFSTACGLSNSIFALIFFRFCQGACSGIMVPVSYNAMMSVYGGSAKTRLRATAIYSCGIMLGPVLGPITGGYLNQYFNWHWVFFINLPLGIAIFILSYFSIPHSKITKTATDYLALLLLMIAVLSLEILLSEGNTLNWLHSRIIVSLLFLSIVSFTLFIKKTVHSASPIINLSLFKSYNFNLSCIFSFILSTEIICVNALIPFLLSNIYHYPTSLTGRLFIIMGPCAIASAIAYQFLVRFLKDRPLCAIGIALIAWGFWLFAKLSISAAPHNLVIPLSVIGFGIGFSMRALNNFFVSGVPYHLIDDSKGLTNEIRMFGYSFGVTIIMAILDRFKQTAWSKLGNHINVFNPNLHTWLEQHNLTLQSATTPSMLSNLLGHQSEFIALISTFEVCALMALGALVILPFFKRIRPAKDMAT